jgi:heme oxygenase (biliverdin-IX-beta and delta-forming)
MICQDSAAQDSDILSALRRATAAQHAVVDRAMPLAAPHAGLEAYREHLLLLQHWLEPVEAWLALYEDGPQDPARVPRVWRTPLVVRDLADPALPVVAARAAPAAAAASMAALPLQGDAAWRWGACYVIEGSQLGGAVLYKRLRAQLSPHPLHYLGAEGSGPGPRWQRFIAALRDAVRSPHDIERACAGAVCLFERLIVSLPSPAHEASVVYA